MEFPTMPRLKTARLCAHLLHTILSMDTAHLPLLSYLNVTCKALQSSSFPESLLQLTLDVPCSARTG